MRRIACFVSGTLAATMLSAATAQAEFDTHAAIFATSFEEDADANYDLWPDHWNRKTSPEYPHYTQIEIVDDPTAHNGRSLRVELDGGGAHIATPAIPILPKFGYKVSVRAKAENLKFTFPKIVVELQNRMQERLQVVVSEPIAADGKWHVVQFKHESIRPSSDEIDRAIVYLDAPRERRGDLNGKVWLDQIVLERLPSMVVKTDSPYNVYNDFREVKVECTLSGIRQQNPDIRFQLLDETSRVIHGKSHTESLQGKLIVEDSFSADQIVGAVGNRPSGYEGSIDWTPNIEDYGFYRIRVEMLREENEENPATQLSDHRELDKREITLAVLPKLPRPKKGEFGWTLPVADKPLSFDVLAELLPRVGVHWVKMPVWYQVDDRDRGEEIVRFAERTSASGIEVVGILDNPLVEDWHLRDPNTPSDIADLLLSDPSFWQPQFEHVMTRLSLRLRWWQLGNDWDTSFYGYPELSKKLLSVRQHLFRFGQDVKLGLGWRWPNPDKDEEWLPSHPNPVWDYEQMSSDPPLDSRGLDRAMAAHASTKAMRWVLVDPTMQFTASSEEDLPPDERKRLHENHVREFVREMVAAKIHGADGIFVANPFTGPEGIMKTDGTPGELLLPWRTTAHLLGGCRYLGKLDLPSHSTNHVFENTAGELLMIVWNDEPTVERLYLGESIERIDVWGKRTPLEADELGRVALAVDRNPSFVMGLHPAVTAWRMAVKFDQLRVPSVFSRAHENLVRGTNHFPQGVTGSFSIFVPPRTEEAFVSKEESEVSIPDEIRSNRTWEVLPRRGELSVAPHEEFQLPIRILLDDAAYGPQPVRIDFRIEADRNYRFSVWRNLRVGLGDVEIEVHTKIDKGQLVVEQKMFNAGSPTDFKCLLFAAPRRRKRTQVVMLGPDGNTKIYQYPKGEQLLGNVLTLRAEEITGNRVLIYRFRAKAGEAAAPTAGDDTETTSVAAPAET